MWFGNRFTHIFFFQILYNANSIPENALCGQLLIHLEQCIYVIRGP